MIDQFNRLFPLWAVLVSVLAFSLPDQFSQLESAIVPLLALVMFMMGLTLCEDDFRRWLASRRSF